MNTSRQMKSTNNIEITLNPSRWLSIFFFTPHVKKTKIKVRMEAAIKKNTPELTKTAT